MRDEQQMFDLFVKVAQKNDMKAIILNGSRVNKNVEKDMFQDYDIVFVVEDEVEVAKYVNNEKIINTFGEILYMQKPNHKVYENKEVVNSYTWLIQYIDGTRIDLRIATISYVQSLIETDSLSKVIYDKENIFRFVRPDETSYFIKKITEDEFLEICNEFWWCLNNVGKGICRGELIYVFDIVNLYIRPMLFKVIDQKIGYENDFKVNVGKNHKFLNKFVEKEMFEKIVKTYNFSTPKSIWDSVLLMCSIFSEIVEDIIKYSNFKYDYNEARNSYSHLKQMQGFYKLLEAKQ